MPHVERTDLDKPDVQKSDAIAAVKILRDALERAEREAYKVSDHDPQCQSLVIRLGQKVRDCNCWLGQARKVLGRRK